jgi:hypothetical protein
MAGQNFIAKILCRLGGDKYTRESMEASLHKCLQAARQNVIHFDVQHDKWILFSDHHRGAKNGADDFQRCEEHYVTALDYYFERGFSLCVLGDSEELWEEFPRVVLRNNSLSFAAEKRFHDAGRYMRLWGNHDEIWGDAQTVQKLLQPIYGGQPLEVPEAMLLEVKDTGETLGNVLLVHGHQGTQNEGKDTRFAKWILHNLWRPIQVVTRFSCNTPATDWRLRRERDRIVYHWAANQPGLILIAGHTHTPVFESYSHRARLMARISGLLASLEMLPETERSAALIRIDELSAQLQTLESTLSPEERQQAEPLENPLPCYFNTGCCAFEDCDITGIEISDGEIRLVRWPDDDGGHRQKVLQAGDLKEIFLALR